MEPIWKEPRSIGINVRNLADDEVVVIEIMYKRKDNKRLYPTPFCLTVRQIKARKISEKVVSGNVRLYIVPIQALEPYTPPKPDLFSC